MTAPDLAAGLARAIGAPVTGLSRSTAGARRTNVVFEAEGRRLVATIVPAGVGDEAGVSPITAEAAVRTRAEEAGVAVPHVVFVSEDPSYVGGPLMISEFIEGETVPRRILRLAEATPGLGEALARQIGASLARLHAMPAATVDTGSSDPATADLAQLAAFADLLPQHRPALAWGLHWLAANRPGPPPRPTTNHGDLRNGNLIVGPEGLRAVLDWELAAAGRDPMEDLAWLTVRMWRFGNDHLEVGGFADREALIDGYTDAGGTYDADRFEWWKAARTLWWGLGLAGQAMGFLAGTTPSIVMAASGRRVSELEWDLLMLARP